MKIFFSSTVVPLVWILAFVQTRLYPVYGGSLSSESESALFAAVSPILQSIAPSSRPTSTSTKINSSVPSSKDLSSSVPSSGGATSSSVSNNSRAPSINSNGNLISSSAPSASSAPSTTIDSSNNTLSTSRIPSINGCNDEWSTCDACCPGQLVDHFGISTRYRLLEREIEDDDCTRTRCVEQCRATWHSNHQASPFPIGCFKNCGCELGTCGYWADNYYFGESYYFDGDAPLYSCGWADDCSGSRSDPYTLYCSRGVVTRSISPPMTTTAFMGHKDSYNYARPIVFVP